jgi:hypothetical protein
MDVHFLRVLFNVHFASCIFVGVTCRLDVN